MNVSSIFYRRVGASMLVDYARRVVSAIVVITFN